MKRAAPRDRLGLPGGGGSVKRSSCLDPGGVVPGALAALADRGMMVIMLL